MEEVANWVAPAATMVAAMMTAANISARVTGYGFVVFTVGSICWTIIGIATGQQNLVLSNGFLTLVNLVGIWRWLGQQAKFAEGSKVAAEKSHRAPVPSLFSAASLVGAAVEHPPGTRIATVVDAMVHCGTQELAYVVVSEGGVAGLGAELKAVRSDVLQFTEQGITSQIDGDALKRLLALIPDKWPEKID